MTQDAGKTGGRYSPAKIFPKDLLYSCVFRARTGAPLNKARRLDHIWQRRDLSQVQAHSSRVRAMCAEGKSRSDHAPAFWSWRQPS